MNFIAHYTRVRKESPYQKLGVIFPDLYPKFSKIYNIHFYDMDPSLRHNESIESRDIHRGIIQHYRDDATFHNLPDFTQFIHDVSIEMNEIEVLVPFKRKNFFTHILFELLLDHQIIENDPQILEEFYRDMALLEESKLRFFCEKYIPEINLNSLFLRNFINFKEARFLELYDRADQLIRVLKRTTASICQWDIESSEINEAILEIILKSKQRVNYKKILTELN